MTLDTWLTFTVLELLLCLSPGPAVLFITATAATRGAGTALAAATGILLANLLYFALSGTGVAAVLLASPSLFLVLRWAGSAYLFYLGVRLLLTSPAHRDAVMETPAQSPEKSIRARVLQGFFVQTLNPKALAYFVALLPQFIAPSQALLPQMLILTATSVLVEASVLGAYIWLTLYLGRRGTGHGRLWIKRLGGACLILAACRLALFG